MEYTQNYQFRKPIRGVDNADVNDLNYNWDKQDAIDNAFYRNFAQNYDSTETYNTGDVVMYEFLLYKCLEDEVTGSWDETKWERTTAGEAGGSTVVPNPTDPPTEELETLGIDDTIYEIVTSKVYGEAEGSLITLTDASAAPAKELKVAIEPQQDLNGYEYPWVGGAGKNKVVYPYQSQSVIERGTWNEQTISESNGKVAVSGTQNELNSLVFATVKLKANTTYTFSTNFQYLSGNEAKIFCTIYDTAKSKLLANPNNDTPVTFTTDQDYTAKIYLNPSSVSNGKVFNYTVQPQLEVGDTATNWQPYSNICPISGWDEVEVVVSPTTDAEDGTTYTIQLGSTYYGGELDVKNGVLNVTDGYIASYNGETLPSTWISDRDVYAPNTSPTTGAEVVYKLATPTEVTLTPTEVTLLLGINNIWADSGDTYIKYKRDLNIFLNDLERRIKALEEG